MSRLPIPGSDKNTWGDILNDFLGRSHNTDGTLQASAVTDAGAMPKAGGSMTGALSVQAKTVRVGEVERPVITYPNSAYFYVDKEDTAGDGSVVFRTKGNIRAEVGIAADDDLHFKTVTGTAGSETFIDALICKNLTGYAWAPLKFGVGTIPVEKLHVAETLPSSRLVVKLENGNSGAGTSRSTNLLMAGTGVQWSVGTDAGLNAGNNFYIKDESANERLFIDTLGQVGLGTTIPGAPLHLTRNLPSGRTILKVENTNTAVGTSRSAAIVFQASGQQWTVGNDDGLNAGNNFVIKDENAGERLFIDTAGRIGIGNTSPNTKLDVSGAIVSRSVTLTDAATINTDASLSNHFRVTLGGNRTLANPVNLTDGQRITYEFIQDATGSRTLSYGNAFVFGTAVPSATLTTTAGKRDFLTCVYNAITTKLYVIQFVDGY